MWVRVYNLPFNSQLNILNVKKVGNKIGTFLKMDSSGSTSIDKSIRPKVLIDVRKPLTKKVKQKMRGAMEDYYEVKYEKLPLFCFSCGKLARAWG